jgi:hypothetical protein
MSVQRWRFKPRSERRLLFAAKKLWFELKRKFPLVQENVFAAKKQTRTIVELPKV